MAKHFILQAMLPNDFPFSPISLNAVMTECLEVLTTFQCHIIVLTTGKCVNKYKTNIILDKNKDT